MIKRIFKVTFMTDFFCRRVGIVAGSHGQRAASLLQREGHHGKDKAWGPCCRQFLKTKNLQLDTGALISTEESP